jgi:hypothetical protein
MPKPVDQKLYDEVKAYVDTKYEKPSAYKSGFIVKLYKQLGGQYENDGKEAGLKRWFKEEWKDIGNKDYPVYRPTRRVNKNTPLTISEIDPSNLQEQIKLKQKIRGTKNLPKFAKNQPNPNPKRIITHTLP